jgi:predicted phosphodiesterase
VPNTETVGFGDHSIYIFDDIHDLQLDPAARGISVVISGHSHRPLIGTMGGSAGPRRFNLPITLATLDLTASSPEALFHHLIGSG